MKSRKATASAAALVSVLVLSGCFSKVAVIHTPAGYIYSASGVTEPLCSDPIDPVAGELTGPHFGMRLTCVASGPSVALMSDIEMSGVYPETVPPPATTGHEFIVTQFGDDDGVRPYHGLSDVEDLVMYFEMGDERVDIVEPPLPGTVLVVVGLIGEPAFLVVEDEGREQRFNLRDGVRDSEIPGYYQATEGLVTTDGYKVRIEGENSSWTGWAEGSGTIGVVRTLWDPENGYAADGRANIVVQLSWYVHERDGKIGWDMDIKKSLTLKSADGEEYEIADVSESDNGTRIQYDVRFDAPSDVTKFEVSFKPNGKLWIPDDGSKLSTTKKPKKTTHEIDFSRD